MSNQVYANETLPYANQEYEFNTDIINTVGPLNVTIKMSKDVEKNVIRLTFPETAIFTKSVADGLLRNDTALPENFRPSADAYANIYVDDDIGVKHFTLGMIRLDTVGIFYIGLSQNNDLFINAGTYGIHKCHCEFPY